MVPSTHQTQKSSVVSHNSAVLPKLSGGERRRVVFFAEDVTLAHVGRMITLAKALDPQMYDVVVATGERFEHFVTGAGLKTVRAQTMPAGLFAKLLAGWRPLYNKARLMQAVNNDVEIIKALKPDLVVGDFRLSLGISAELTNVPYFNVVNGVWSPGSRVKWTTPDHWLMRYLPATLMDLCTRPFIRLAFWQHAAAFRAVRQAFGLAPRVQSLRDAYTDATVTLYADIPELAPVKTLPKNHHFIGPVGWQPDVELPEFWSQPVVGKLAYVNLGSSGDVRMLKVVADALGDLPMTVHVATAGRSHGMTFPKNFRVADYLPGSDAAQRADVVISNGGSGTIYQGVAAGVPMVHVPSNGDQFLCSSAHVQTGAGIMLRASTVQAHSLRAAVQHALTHPSFAASAKTLADHLGTFKPSQAVFADLVADRLDGKVRALAL